MAMERQPVAFLERGIDQALASARELAARFVGADPTRFAFVPNATTGVNTAIHHVDLQAGDRVIVTDHAYPAIANTVQRVCDRAGAAVDVLRIPLPLSDDEQILERFRALLGPRTRLAIIEHVTSPTAVVLPVARLVEECRARDVLSLIDAAHAPGMVPVDVDALGCDLWTGNFHKWVCAPKGSGALVVSETLRARVRPLVTSQPWLESFTDAFGWTGTHDPSAYLSTPAAIEFMGTFGWDRMRALNHELVVRGRDVVGDSIGAVRLVPDEATAWMAIVPLPTGVATTRGAARALQARLYEQHRIEVPFVAWNGRGLVRLSAHVYNRPEDFQALADALPGLLRGT